MIAIDTNILVYAHRPDSEFHERAVAAVADIAESQQRWAFPWPVAHEFLAVVTNRRVFRFPTQLTVALQQLNFWFAVPGVSLLGESPSHWSQFQDLAVRGQITGPMLHDARIAAICLEHGVDELWTADRDFSRMAGLKLRNPLL